MSDIMILEQIIIEDKYSRKNIRAKIMKDIEKSDSELHQLIVKGMFQIQHYYDELDTYWGSKQNRVRQLMRSNVSLEDIVIDILTMVLPVSGAQPIQGVVGQLAEHLDYDELFDGIQTAAELVAVVCYSDLYDIIPASDSDTGSLMIQSNFTLEEDTLQYIVGTKYLPPLVCKPMLIEHNGQSGYYTKEESIILGRGNHHKMKQGLDAINIANAVPLTLDRSMLRFKEVSKQPLDTKEKLNQHRRLVNSSKVVYKELLESGNKFFFNWKGDKRGRLYSQGYHVNIQSTSFKKAIINLHEKHTIEGVPA